MDRVMQLSRFLVLGLAFTCAMALVGGMLGGMGGFVLILLSHTVLGLKAGMPELMPGCLAFGVLSFMGLSLALLAPHAPRPVFQTSIAVKSESN